MRDGGHEPTEWERLRDRLAQVDPASEPIGLSPEAVARIRRAMHLALRERHRRPRGKAALAIATAFAAVLVIGYSLQVDDPTNVGPTIPTAAPGSDESAASAKIRLEYVAVNGVRLVWTIDPEFRLNSFDSNLGGNDDNPDR